MLQKKQDIHLMTFVCVRRKPDGKTTQFAPTLYNTTAFNLKADTK